MQKTNVKAIAEAGVMSSIAVIAGLIITYFPLLGGIISPLWPVPITLLGVRHGYKWSIWACVASGLIIGILTDPVRAAKVLFICPIGIVLGYAFRAGYGPSRTLLLGSLAAAASFGAYAALTVVLLGVNPFSLDIGDMQNGLTSAMSIYRTMGVPADQLVQLQTTFASCMKLLQILIPLTFISTSVFTAYINFALARRILKRLGHTAENFLPFKLWSMPRYVVYLLILGLGLNFWGQRHAVDWLFRLGENLKDGGLMLAYIQGLALIYFLADKYNLSRPVRGIILLLVSFTAIPILAGIFDLALDYRRLRTPHSS